MASKLERIADWEGLALSLFVLLNAGQGEGAVPYIAPEWKAHFRAKLIIENCVFERSTFSWGNKTNLYQFRCQENGFLFREISSLNDVGLDHISPRNTYAGGFGRDFWAIEGGEVLKLFPDGEGMIKERKNPEASL